MSEDLPELPPDDEPTATDAKSWQVPWADETNWDAHWATDPGAAGWSDERRLLALSFAVAIRKTGSLTQVMSQIAADIIGINATDLNCLNILSFSGSLTAGELAKATGLTTASITGVVDRLEAAGFVSRERDPNDRRRVVVTITLEKAVSEVAPVFAPMVADWQQLARTYSDDELRLIVRFYDQMEQIIRKHLARLREQRADPGG
jgi:DNA-binding MarR family transcriptional regulator